MATNKPDRSTRPGRWGNEPRKLLISQRTLLLIVAAVGAGVSAAASPVAATAITVGAAVLILLNGVTDD